jgi:pyrroloquinoline quinone biosynthesis protein B
MGRLTAIVLGSAAGGDFPQWNCRCPVCELAWMGDSRATPRMQTGLAVSADGERWTLINASPDLRAQIRRTPALQPRRLRGSLIEAVVLTGAEIDQIAGLLSLREGTPFALYATGETQTAMNANTMFSALRAVRREAVAFGQPVALPGGVSAELFAVPGKAPLYREGDNPQLDAESEATAGIEPLAGGKRLICIPGAAAVTPSMRERCMRADAVLFDGTLYTDDELQKRGVGEKTRRRMGHISIAGVDGSLAALRGVECRRSYIDINNTNPVLVAGTAERKAVEAAGWEIAHVQYYGWALTNRAALMPSREQAETAMRDVEMLRAKYRGWIVIDAVVPDYHVRYPKPCVGGWGRRSLNVTPSGKVLPCHAAESIPDLQFCNVRERPLADIWRHSLAFNAFRGTEWMREPCRSCERREQDFGGCCCQAFLMTGDARAADPVCHL